MAGVQGVGVVGSQNPPPVGEQLLESGGRPGGVTGLTPPAGEIAAGRHELEEHREISPHDLLTFKVGVGLDEGAERAPVRYRIEVCVRNEDFFADVLVS